MEVEKCYAPLPDGSVLYYEKTGSGCPLFLLHGNGGSSAYFSKQVDALRQKHQLYLIDSRGHGKSTNTQKKIDFFKMATDLLAIIQQENLSKIALLGFSDGANLAMVFCHLYPEYVSCMILNSGNTEPRELDSFLEWECLAISDRLALFPILKRNAGLSPYFGIVVSSNRFIYSRFESPQCADIDFGRQT